MTLTKAQIVENLFAKNLFTKGESAQIIETLFELIKQSLQDGEDVMISGFGKFFLKEKHQRKNVYWSPNGTASEVQSMIGFTSLALKNWIFWRRST
jgi:nucleoid DNA-binding protein